MIRDALFQHTNIPLASKGLDTAALRLRAVANNIANINTDGYRRIEVRFEEQLRRALDKKQLQGTKTDLGHLSLGRPNLADVKPRAFLPEDFTNPSGHNNVNIDMEMARMAQAQLQFEANAKIVKNQMETIMKVITGGE